MNLDHYTSTVRVDPVTTASLAFAAAWRGDTERCNYLLAALPSEQLLRARAVFALTSGIALEAHHIGGLTP